MVVSGIFKQFFESERAGGLVLMFCTVLSILLTNLGVTAYVDFWNIEFAGHTLVHWTNDGLMVIFFLMIGLELEREIYNGELSNLRSAMLPIFAALGGMLVPAGIYLLINSTAEGGDTAGAGIPMATDIAFALGALSLLGNRVPLSLKVFLTGLAVIDDLGAILVIAIFYTDTLNWVNLGAALGIFAFLLLLNRLKVWNMIPYLIGGVFMWYFMLSSGVHATITGVLLAFAMPFAAGDETSPSNKLETFLHRPVAFIILPIFALANTCILINAEAIEGLSGPVALGIMAGLLLGKPIGISLFTLLATKLGIARLAPELRGIHVFGTALLGGIGFTMSIFITLLAFSDPGVIDVAKLAIVGISLVSGILGYIMLDRTLKEKAPTH